MIYKASKSQRESGRILSLTVIPTIIALDALDALLLEIQNK